MFGSRQQDGQPILSKDDINQDLPVIQQLRWDGIEVPIRTLNSIS
jgi:hypothetical protein